jgi:membrane protease YdiL (CAAX protease family)
VRVPRDVAWVIVLSGLFTAGLLRQFHEATLRAPFLPPALGSLSFACIVVLVLVGIRERSLGAVGGRGVRLGSLTPLLLLLFVEKWASQALAPAVVGAAVRAASTPAEADARLRAFSGVALLALAVALSFLSTPARRTVLRWTRPSRWPAAAAGTLLAGAATFAVLAGLALGLGAGLRLAVPDLDRTWAWVFGGQAVRAFAEEIYFRGLVLAELLRLMPRLGISDAAARRWVALTAAALLFGLEHASLGAGAVRLAVFTVSLGILFGLLVLVTANLHYAAGIHALVNWVLLGAVPQLVDASGRPALPSGTWVGLVLIFAFVLAFLLHGRRAPARA